MSSACNRSDNPEYPDTIFATCTYENRFSKSEECREYRGEEWTESAASSDCEDWGGSLVVGGVCSYPSILGACILEGGTEAAIRVVVPGDDARECRSQERGCELFGGGVFLPAPVCGGEVPDEASGSVFQPPELECKAPLAGEPAGEGPEGQVCTWSMISGCTEEGRRFADYASCDRVRTQRPYAAVPPAPAPEAPDTRVDDDPAYAAELAWVTAQVEASACVCCHQASITPEGAAIWDIDAPGNWVNTFSPYGLAFAGGFLDSSLLGAYPPEENHGFDRSRTGIPSTDPDRLRAFFEGELIHRGYTVEEWASYDPVPAPFYQQAIFEPVACAEGEGIGDDGKVNWSGGAARYLYVLEASADNPGVPPDLDLPQGTLWRLDVAWDQPAVRSGEVGYGDVPAGTSQRLPDDTSPPALTPGSTYYLYVLADIAVPITRCLFTAR
ncbi:MAG: hypothetical protein R3B09_32220 [Nannocystaceae bacterium]